ncbi:MAG: (d)CMP kinase [Paludibacteraceae bacterium]|nr:(d)CMP kinase [Paludibacteraceae bacterium]
MKKIIVAIDGYSSCGKSTIAKQLAKYAGYTYVDTGAMYRAVALYAIENLGNLGNLECLESLEYLETHIHLSYAPDLCLNGTPVEDKIRSLEVGNMASKISPIPAVRQFLVAQQQAMGQQKGIVMDGRDIGTVVFPNAELKFFLTASPEVRAERRFKELQAKGEQPVFEEVLKDVNERDYRDTHREISPLKQAPDAIVVDNSNMTREQQMEAIYAIFDRHNR